MYTRLLVPLDGSKAAEAVLPHARTLATRLKIPVELMAVVDIAEMAAHVAASNARFLDTMVERGVRECETYLQNSARTFAGASVKCNVEKGRAGEAIIERAGADAGTLIAMATHGRSGLNRWLLGSVAEKVLRGCRNPLLLVRASEAAKAQGEGAIKSVIVPLDGSELAESVLPAVVELAKKLAIEVILFRAYNLPYSVYSGTDGFAAIDFDELLAGVRDEAQEYLEKKVEAVKRQGVQDVSYVMKEGFSADKIIGFGREKADSVIAMCSHGRSGVRRWVLGSVTETVVRHSDEPVLVVRAG